MQTRAERFRDTKPNATFVADKKPRNNETDFWEGSTLLPHLNANPQTNQPLLIQFPVQPALKLLDK